MTAAIRLMGVAIAFQLPSGLYIGGLMGLQRQVLTNSIQIAWGLFRGAGAVLVLWLLSPTIFAFASWQLTSNALYCFVSRLTLWRTLEGHREEARPNFTWQALRSTWRYALGMTGMAILSTLLIQTDKLAVSKMLPLEMLGYYTLASAVASIPLMLASPIASAVFPRLTGLVATGERINLTRLYHRTCELVSVAVIPASLTSALFAGDFIRAWTGSPIIAQRAGLTASLLLVGQAMQAMTIVPYYLALAHGNIRLNLQVGIASVVVITPLLIVLIMKYGIVGAGMSWVLMNLCSLPPYMYLLHRRFLPTELRTWATRDVTRPLLAALPVVLLARFFLPLPSSRPFTLSLIGLVCTISAAATTLASPELRNLLKLATRLTSQAATKARSPVAAIRHLNPIDDATPESFKPIPRVNK
jgi:O-antigen/teichoic acid export membrane protein